MNCPMFEMSLNGFVTDLFERLESKDIDTAEVRAILYLTMRQLLMAERHLEVEHAEHDPGASRSWRDKVIDESGMFLRMVTAIGVEASALGLAEAAEEYAALTAKGVRDLVIDYNPEREPPSTFRVREASPEELAVRDAGFDSSIMNPDGSLTPTDESGEPTLEPRRTAAQRYRESLVSMRAPSDPPVASSDRGSFSLKDWIPGGKSS